MGLKKISMNGIIMQKISPSKNCPANFFVLKNMLLLLYTIQLIKKPEVMRAAMRYEFSRMDK